MIAVRVVFFLFSPHYGILNLGGEYAWSEATDAIILNLPLVAVVLADMALLFLW